MKKNVIMLNPELLSSLELSLSETGTGKLSHRAAPNSLTRTDVLSVGTVFVMAYSHKSISLTANQQLVQMAERKNYHLTINLKTCSKGVPQIENLLVGSIFMPQGINESF